MCTHSSNPYQHFQVAAGETPTQQLKILLSKSALCNTMLVREKKSIGKDLRYNKIYTFFFVPCSTRMSEITQESSLQPALMQDQILAEFPSKTVCYGLTPTPSLQVLVITRDSLALFYSPS